MKKKWKRWQGLRSIMSVFRNLPNIYDGVLLQHWFLVFKLLLTFFNYLFKKAPSQGLTKTKFHTGWPVWVPKKISPKKQVKSCKFTCLVLKKKFYETFSSSLLITPSTANAEREFSALTLISIFCLLSIPKQCSPKIMTQLMWLFFS